MSLYYKGLPAHMRAYANDRELEGFLGRLQALKNKVVMQSEIDNEDVGERLAQLEELKRAALERRAANKKPKVGQEGMSEADKQIIEDAKVREKKAKAFGKLKAPDIKDIKRGFARVADKAKEIREEAAARKIQEMGLKKLYSNMLKETPPPATTAKRRGNPNWTPGSEAAKKAGSTGGKGKTKILLTDQAKAQKKATQNQ